MDLTSLPFNQLIDLRLAASGGQTSVVLDPGGQHLNHAGTVHAGVLYTVGEAASAHCLISRFPELSDSAVAVLRTATVKYRKPAVGRLCGVSKIASGDEEEFRHRFEKSGRGLIKIVTSVMQGELEIMSGAFTWFVTRRGDEDAE